MATPKRVRKEERDYADIYQENFVRNNDPAALGQAAFNRQLSNGIQRNMGQERLAANTAMPPVIPGLSGAGGQAQATGMQRAIIEQDALIGRERREDELRRGVSATQRAGYSPVDTAQMAMDRRAGAMARAERGDGIGLGGMPSLADAANDPNIDRIVGAQARAAQPEPGLTDSTGPQLENLGYSPAALARASQGEVGLIDPNFRQRNVLGDAVNDANIDRRVAAERRAEQGEVGLTDPTVPSIESQRRERQISPAERRAEQGEVGLTGSTGLDIPTLERMSGIMPSELGTARTLYPGTGLQPPKTKEEMEAELDAAVEAGTAFVGGPGVTPDTTPEPYGGPEDDDGGPEDEDGNKITLSGATASYDNGIKQEEQRLTDQLIAEENAVLQNFNQKYNQFLQMAINRGAVRGDLESQGFTGGIGQQIKDYLSTQEIVALNQLIAEKDQALQAIDLERNNIPNLAKTNYIQSLQLESASLEAQNAFSQMISSKVLDGTMTLSEANGLAEQYGLRDVQSVFESAIEAQIAAGTMNKDSATAELERLGLDTSFLDKIGKTEFTDFATSKEAADLERQINALLTEAGEADVADIGGGIIGGAIAGAVAGAILPVGGPILGAIIGGIAGGISGTGMDLNKQDLGTLTSGLFNTELILQEGRNIMTGEIDNVSIKKPAGQGTSFGELGLQFQVNVNGKQYQMEGADLVILAAALKKKGYDQTDPRYRAIFTTAASIHRNSGAVTFGSTLDYLGGQKYSTVYKFYNQAMGRSTALFGADFGGGFGDLF